MRTCLCISEVITEILRIEVTFEAFQKVHAHLLIDELLHALAVHWLYMRCDGLSRTCG